jgi:hypothetical protein
VPRRRGGDCAGRAGVVGRDLEEEEACLFLLEVRHLSFREVACLIGGDLTVCSCLRRVVPTVPPLAPAKVLRADASIPTQRRSSRAPRAGSSAVATAGESSQGAAEASRP